MKSLYLPIKSILPEATNACMYIVMLSILSNIDVESFALFGVYLSFQSFSAMSISCGRNLIFEKKMALKSMHFEDAYVEYFAKNIAWAILIAIIIIPLLIKSGFSLLESLLCVISAFAISTWPTWLYIAQQNYKRLYVYNLFPKAVTVLPLLFLNDKCITFSEIILFNGVGNVLLLAKPIRLVSRNYPMLKEKIKLFLSYRDVALKYAMPWFELATISNALMRNGLIIIINYFFSPSAVALYMMIEKMGRAYQSMGNVIINAELNKVFLANEKIDTANHINCVLTVMFLPVSYFISTFFFSGIVQSNDELIVCVVIFAASILVGSFAFIITKKSILGTNNGKVFFLSNAIGFITSILAAFVLSKYAYNFVAFFPYLFGEIALLLSMKYMLGIVSNRRLNSKCNVD